MLLPAMVLLNVWKAVPKESWPDDEESPESIAEKWVEPFGDMRQELVFIGQNLDQKGIIQELDQCLLDEQELLAGKAYWQTLEDPFPDWERRMTAMSAASAQLVSNCGGKIRGFAQGSDTVLTEIYQDHINISLCKDLIQQSPAIHWSIYSY